jgi:hypothetical protein
MQSSRVFEGPRNLETRLGMQAAVDLPGTQCAEVFVTRISWHGWPDCYLLSNGQVEAVVVPAVGRVMQLRLAGAAGGAFWVNPALNGQMHDPASQGWVNFGGDKCWPAPQSAWTQQQGRDWPPPVAFDSRTMEAVAGERGVTLTSSVDPGFGIQVTRHVELDAELPVMRIRSEYRKVTGEAVRVGVWTISQMREPEQVYMLLPAESIFAGGFTRLIEAEPEGLRVDGRLLSLARRRSGYIKIGSDAVSMAWVGSECVVRIDAEAGPGEYPDGGCVTEIYTNPDPLPYVELETLGPLANLSVGDRIERTAVYTIMARTAADPDAEARKLFNCESPGFGGGR